eukprot:GHVS01098217.1.p1 GENE.GHVS01098217.1~~GHVS01098217.1.p1  ORF type:complete len:401 (+),score=57.57 GHVS01098217.1:152-1354(+)
MSYPSVHPTNPSVPFNNRNDMERREGQSPVVGMATSVPVHSPPQHVVEPRRYHVLEQEQLQEPQEREVLCGCFRPIKHCCGCIPVRTGIVTLAVLYFLGAVNCLTFLMIRPDSFRQVSLCPDSPTEPIDMSYVDTFPSSAGMSDKTDFHSSSQNDFDHVSQQEQPPTIYIMPKKTTIRGAAHTLSTTTPPMSHHVMDKRRLVGSATSSSPYTTNLQPVAGPDPRNHKCWDKNDVRRLRASILGVFCSHLLLGVTMVLGVQLPATQRRLDILMIPFVQLMIASFVQLAFSAVCLVGGVISLFLAGYGAKFYSPSFLAIVMFVSAVLCFLSAVPLLHFAHVVWSYRVHGKRLLQRVARRIEGGGATTEELQVVRQQHGRGGQANATVASSSGDRHIVVPLVT